jgi:hypothetical protein
MRESVRFVSSPAIPLTKVHSVNSLRGFEKEFPMKFKALAAIAFLLAVAPITHAAPTTFNGLTMTARYYQSGFSATAQQSITAGSGLADGKFMTSLTVPTLPGSTHPTPTTTSGVLWGFAVQLDSSAPSWAPGDVILLDIPLDDVNPNPPPPDPDAAVPEPTSLILLSSGMAFIGALRRRQTKSNQ